MLKTVGGFYKTVYIFQTRKLSSCGTNVMKVLNVAEKNDAAKTIANLLSKGTSRRREGYSAFNKIYEFEATVLRQKRQMVMTSVSGHLLSLEFVAPYRGWKTCDPCTLFEAPVYKYCQEFYEKIKKTLQQEVRDCDALIIWTDCDREGENIGYEIIEVCEAVNRNLNVYRATFSEITTISVQRALNNLGQPDEKTSKAVDVRIELDLRIGAAFTRFQTTRLFRAFPEQLADRLISYGSCQFPTLGFVVERYRAVENFVSEPFWKIKVLHTQNELTVDFAWDRVRLFSKSACEVLHECCLESPQAKVTEVKTKPKSKWRPLPLDTVELEKLASRQLKLNAKTTMKIAEKLYTQGLISYPRTETNKYPEEMNLTNLVNLQTGDPNWGSFAQRILDDGGPTPRHGNKTDKAHPPIHPTKHTTGLTGDEKRVYDFIVRAFLACCSKDAVGQETTVCIEIAGEKFHASGLMIIARNYLDVYPYDKWSAKEIHIYEQGQVFDPTSIELVDGKTAPPNLLTEADLIALMEKHGIGTDATHAEHIETIKSRSYVSLLENAYFVPGVLGMGLVDGYDDMGVPVSKPHLRAQLEADLKLICEGKKDPTLVLAEQIQKYKEIFITTSGQVDKLVAALAKRLNVSPSQSYTETPVQDAKAFQCPKCNNYMILRPKKNSDEMFIGCQGFPECKNVLWLPSFVKSVEILPETCQTCGPNVSMFEFKWKRNSIEHLYPSPYKGCVYGCDPSFLDALNISRSWRRNNEQRVNRPSTDVQNPNQRTTVISAQSNVRSLPNSMSEHSSQERPRPQSRSLPTQRLPPQSGGLPPQRAQDRHFLAQRPQNGNIPTQSQRESDNSRWNEAEIMCKCNQHAILLTVRKNTANQGKMFYKCPMQGGCDFFLWAPETEDRTAAIPPTTTSQENLFISSDSPPKCHCDRPCKRLTAQREGPNKLRPYFICPKTDNSKCDFFKWADAPKKGPRNTNPPAAGNETSQSARKCRKCRQVGHNRATCPN